jgi:membrane protease YdiL (CAAX protease family)
MGSGHNHYLPGVRGMFMLLLMFFAGALLGNLLNISLVSVFDQDFIDSYGTLISYPVMFVPAILYASRQSRLNRDSQPAVPLDRNGFGQKDAVILTSACIFSTIAAAYIVEPVSMLLPPMPSWLEEAMEQMLKNAPLWATLISVSIFAPLFEEWLCRGMVLRGLLHTMSPLKAICISSVFFAVLHLNPWQAIPAFCLGMLFGYVYYRTGSLKLTMLMHCTNNTMAALISKTPQFEGAETFMDILSPWAYWCIYATCILIVLSCLIIFKSTKAIEKHGH